MIGRKGVKKSANKKALVKAGLVVGRALLQGIPEAGKLSWLSQLVPLSAGFSDSAIVIIMDIDTF